MHNAIPSIWTEGNVTYVLEWCLANSNLLASRVSPVHATNYQYESNRDLITVIDNINTSGRISRYQYANDVLGRRSQRKQEGSAFGQTSTDSFSYNDRNEVIASSNNKQSLFDAAYSFDNIGNRLSFTQAGTTTTNYTPNSLNQYIDISTLANSPSYDADGNTLLKGDGWEYIWNGENRLIEAKNLLLDQRLTFQYDYQGRRVEKKVSTWDSNTQSYQLAQHTLFLYDGWNLIAKIDALNTPTLAQSYLWGHDLSGSPQGAGGVGGLLMISDPSSHYYPSYDYNGNITALTQEDGSLAGQYRYSPFGQLIQASGDYAAENPFRFSTKYQDNETGLLYYGFRYYDAELGRWLNRDPIEEEGGMNLYGFVGNDGVNHFDLLGEAVFISSGPQYDAARGGFWIGIVGCAEHKGKITNVSSDTTQGIYQDHTYFDMDIKDDVKGRLCRCDGIQLILSAPVTYGLVYIEVEGLGEFNLEFVTNGDSGGQYYISPSLEITTKVHFIDSPKPVGVMVEVESPSDLFNF